MEKLLSIAEAAQLLCVNPQTLRRWDKSQKLSPVIINDRGDRKYRFSDIQHLMKPRPLKVVSLFAGCGGMDLGFQGNFNFLNKYYEKNNYEIVYANDINQKACDTYKANIGDHIVSGDFTELVKNHSQIPDCDIVLGGFPCQDFSVAGKRMGLEAKRGQLYLSMVELINHKKPMAFVAENVKGLLNIGKGEVIKIIQDDFSKVGYNVTVNLFNTADFGVPETRERVIICGIRSDLNKVFIPPIRVHQKKGLEKLGIFDIPESGKYWITAKEALGSLEALGEGEFPNHFWSKAKLTPGTQGNSKISAEKPGPTMRAEHHGNIEYHYSLDRRLSAREAARIQSFPDDFIFYKSTSDAYRQIGNAVAPVFAWHIARALEKSLRDS